VDHIQPLGRPRQGDVQQSATALAAANHLMRLDHDGRVKLQNSIATFTPIVRSSFPRPPSGTAVSTAS
jgi:hypothetical protein